MQVVDGDDQSPATGNADEKLAQRLERKASQRDGLGDRRFPLPTGLGYGRNPQHHREQSRQRDDVVRQHALGAPAAAATPCSATGCRQLRRAPCTAPTRARSSARRARRRRRVSIRRPRKDRTNALLPMPDGPHTYTAAARPRVTVRYASSRTSSSRVRPMNGASASGPAASSGADAATGLQPSPLSASRPDNRRAGSRHISPMQIELRSAGTSGASSEGDGGSHSLLRRSTSISGPRKGIFPVSASYSVAPTPYQSPASEGGMPEPSSGDTYAGVPPMMCSAPPRLSGKSSVIRPKSSITTRPSGVTSTLDGLISRWSFPRRCSAETPSTSCRSADVRRSIDRDVRGPRLARTPRS